MKWVVFKSLFGGVASKVLFFRTKEEAEAYAAKEGGRVMTHREYDYMRM